jgi:uncharacterized membrane protein YccC
MNWTTRQGLVVALSVLAAVVVAGFAGLQDAWWAAISAWAVANADRAQVFAKATMRAFGTVAGCTLGFLLASAFGEHPLLMVLAMFGIGAIGTRRRFGNTRYGYAWILFAVTALMMLFADLTAPDALYLFALNRGYEILTGVFCAMVAGVLLAPASETSAPALTGAASHDFDLDRLSLLGGLLPVAVALIWRELELPAANQIAVSSLVVLDRDLAASHIRGGQRFAGCLVGGLAGLLIAGLGVENVWLWATALGGGLFLFSRIHVGGGPDAYFGTQAGVAFILALVTGLGPPTNVIPAFDRLVGITFGVAIAIGLAHLLAPLPQLRFWRSSS